MALQQQFQAAIVAHASQEPLAPSNDASVAAQQWLTQIETKAAAAAADDAVKRGLKTDLVLLTYYGLFNANVYSSALVGICPR